MPFRAIRRQPDDGRAVAAGGEHVAAVRREAHGGDFLRVAGERENFFAGVASHSLAVLSWLPVRTRVPSGENATDGNRGRVAGQLDEASLAGLRRPKCWPCCPGCR